MKAAAAAGGDSNGAETVEELGRSLRSADTLGAVGGLLGSTHTLGFGRGICGTMSTSNREPVNRAGNRPESVAPGACWMSACLLATGTMPHGGLVAV
jgi:hypothetical protein